MAPSLSGQTSIFGVVFFVSESLLGIKTKKLENIDISNVAYSYEHCMEMTTNDRVVFY